MKTAVLLFLVFCFEFNSYAQSLNFIWAKSISGSSNTSTELVSDNFGNVINVGYFVNTCDFNPGTPTQNIVAGSTYDGYVQKLTENGDFVWAVSFEGGESYCRSVAVFSDNSIIITGRFSGTVDFNPGSGTYLLNTGNSFPNGFVVKLDQNGNFQWAFSFGNNDYSEGLGVKVDFQNNVILTGYFRDVVDFDPSATTFILTSSGISDIFVLKLSPIGGLIWAFNIGDIDDEQGHHLAVDNAGNFYITGYFMGIVDFDPGPGSNPLLSNGYSYDSFLAKYDMNGILSWAKNFGSTSTDIGYNVGINSSGVLGMVGEFTGTMDIDPGPGISNIVSAGAKDGFIIRISPLDGSLVWGFPIGGTAGDACYGFGLAQDGKFYITGEFRNTVDFNPGTNVDNMVSSGNADIFVSSYSDLGNYLVSYKLGNSSDFDIGESILCVSNLIYVTGRFYTTVDFDPGTSTSNLTSTSSNTFVQKMYHCDSSFDTLTIQGCISSYTVPSGNETYFSSGTYSDTLTNALGCDSIITIYLTLLNSDTSLNLTVCNSFTVPSGDETYFFSGTYLDTLPNSNSCDSIITINLIILQSTSSTISEIECYSYLSPSGGETYFSSGVFMDTIPNSVGCDSIITINLTIIQPTSSFINPANCISYISPSGGEIYYSSGIYYDTIPNAVGCDSIIQIDLTIFQNSSSTINFAACDSFMVPSGDEQYNTSGVYLDTIPNANGCDSLITFNLDVNFSSSVTFSQSVCNEYTVPSGDETYYTSGIYFDTIPNTSGCNTYLEMDITINNNVFVIEEVSACKTYLWPGTGITYFESGNYYSYLNTTTGCDSIVNLVLELIHPNTEISKTGPDLISNQQNGTYQWFLCNPGYQPIAGENDSIFTPLFNGYYAVEVTYLGCTDTSSCIGVVDVGTNNLSKKNPFKVYPNPASDVVYLTWEPGDQPIWISLFNLAGQLLEEIQVVGNSLQAIPLPAAPGLYLVEVTEKNQTQKRRFLVSKI